MSEITKKEIQNCLEVFSKNGIILYPTDTIWGLGCPALDKFAIEKIYQIKNRPKEKNLILLVNSPQMLTKYTQISQEKLQKILKITEDSKNPLTVIYPESFGLPYFEGQSVAIRLTFDPFCVSLIDQMQEPLVSTSANISSEITAANFAQINPKIKESVDYIVNYRQEEVEAKQSSKIIKLSKNGEIEVIRE